MTGDVEKISKPGEIRDVSGRESIEGRQVWKQRRVFFRWRTAIHSSTPLLPFF
jgi:hypothetical protein